jgi:hypothetical protein
VGTVSTHRFSFYRYVAHANLASASNFFLAAFSAGVSAWLGDFADLVCFEGNKDRSSDVVDRAVDVDFIDILSFSVR